MSILNFHISKDRALIAVDSMSGGPAGERIEVNKMMPFALGNFVLAGRGHPGMLAFASTLGFQTAGDFDSTADSMPALLAEGFQIFMNLSRKMGVNDATLWEQEIALVGYSEHRQSMVGLHYHRKTIDGPFELQEVDGTCLSPGAECFPRGPLPEPIFLADMQSVSQRQTEYMTRNCPHVATGGRLVFAEIHRGSMTIGSLPLDA